MNECNATTISFIQVMDIVVHNWTQEFEKCVYINCFTPDTEQFEPCYYIKIYTNIYISSNLKIIINELSFLQHSSCKHFLYFVTLSNG